MKYVIHFHQCVVYRILVYLLMGDLHINEARMRSPRVFLQYTVRTTVKYSPE